MRVDLSGRSILVTGGGSGIGAACCLQMAEAGAFVWVNDRDAAAAGRTADLVGFSKAVPGDVARPHEWAHQIHGPLHGIVNNAGYDLSSPVGGTDMDAFEQLQRVMVTGPFALLQLLLPALEQAEGACVVFISSVHALATEPATSAYAAAKGGQISMVRSLIQDLGPKRIRAVNVSPGYVDTPLLGKWIDSTEDPAATRSHASGLHPLGRMGRPDDIARAVAFLISPLAEFINGTNLVVDGGLTAHLYR